MSYRVEYTPQTRGAPAEKSGSVLVILMTLTVFILFLFAVHNYFPNHRTSLQNMIWPGDPAVTQTALKTMTEEIKNGLPFSQAAAAFCTEIFRNADVR